MANVSSSNGLEKRPSLRFPGFDEPWVTKQFSDVFSFLSNNTLSRADLISSGDIHNIHYGDVLIKYGSIIDVEYDDIPYIAHGRESKGTPYLRDGDVIIADTAEDETVGKCCEIININDAKVESGLHTIPCRPMLTFAPMFLGYYMNSYYYHKQLFPLMQGVKVLSISKGNIGGTLISLPRSHSEQKKIVDLLRLIDIRIRKQQQIIETLKKYKRGAITHILSGKSYEFAAEATWTERTLAELCCEFRSGRNISATLIHETGDYPVYGGNGIRGYCGQYSHDGEYVVVGRQGALCGNVRLIQGKNYLSEHAIAVRANEENETKFLLYLLDYMKLGQYSDQGAQPGLAVNKLLRLKCTVPDKKTQSKIASFLMRHDSQISAQERMLALLTNQRRAFLQQLFI